MSSSDFLQLDETAYIVLCALAENDIVIEHHHPEQSTALAKSFGTTVAGLGAAISTLHDYGLVGRVEGTEWVRASITHAGRNHLKAEKIAGKPGRSWWLPWTWFRNG